jgi:hypothetical protein
VLPVHVPAEKGRVVVDHPAPVSLAPAHPHAIAENTENPALAARTWAALPNRQFRELLDT